MQLVVRMESSGGSSSLNLSTSSGVHCAPALVDQNSDSRSSSVRSAGPIKGQLKDKSRSVPALARTAGGSRTGNRNMSRDPPMSGNVPIQQSADVRYQQVNQVYVAPSMDSEVVDRAASAVLQAQTEAHQSFTEAQRIAHTAQTEVHHVKNEAQRIVHETEARAQQVVASTQVSATQALYEQDQRLRAEFIERERALVNEVQRLKESLAASQNQLARDQLRQNDAELERKVGQLVERMATFETTQ